MLTIKKVPSREMERFCRLAADAYTAMNCHVDAEFERMKKKITADEKLANVSTWGAYRDGEMVGGVRLIDFWGTLFETRILYGGGGFLAVDLLHKKEKIARELMLHFLRHYRELDSPMAILYPFRPDFYRKMGFGYGAKINEYRFKPSDLPSSAGKEHLRMLTPRDVDNLVQCHNRVAAVTHGMLDRSGHELTRLKNPANRLVGYFDDNQLRGFMVTGYRQLGTENFVNNDLIVNEMLYESREVLAEFLCYLNSQSDQNRRIRIISSDDFLHYLPVDPRDDTDNFVGPIAQQSNRQGVALMYRVIDVVALFDQLSKHAFGEVDLLLELDLRDAFLPENEGEYLIQFRKGRPSSRKNGRSKVRIGMKVEDFSSLLMGTIDFYSLYNYGLAEISDRRQIATINRMFAVPRPPICYTQF